MRRLGALSASAAGAGAILFSSLNSAPAADVGQPVVTTGDASRVGAASARLDGTVNPVGQPTTYHFQYGKGSAFAHSTAVKTAEAGITPVDVSALVQGLEFGTTYSYRVVATNAFGTATGAARQFTTLDPRLAGRFEMRVKVRGGGAAFHQHRGDAFRRDYRLDTSCSGPRCPSLRVRRQSQRGHFHAVLDRRGPGVYRGTERFDGGRCDNGLRFKSRVRIVLRVVRVKGNSARRVKGTLRPKVAGCVTGSEHASLSGSRR